MLWLSADIRMVDKMNLKLHVAIWQLRNDGNNIHLTYNIENVVTNLVVFAQFVQAN